VILKIRNFEFGLKFEMSKIKILNMSSKSLTDMKPILLINEINEIEENLTIFFVWYCPSINKCRIFIEQ